MGKYITAIKTKNHLIFLFLITTPCIFFSMVMQKYDLDIFFSKREIIDLNFKIILTFKNDCDLGPGAYLEGNELVLSSIPTLV